VPAVFISYRRDDTVGTAGRLYDRLVERLGAERVYRDIESGSPGEDYVATIRARLEACDVLLALIGPNWLRAVDEQGLWRLAKDDDLVRLEIAVALERGIRVVPVLIGGATMPRAGDLPSSIARLAQRNAVELRETQFDRDATQLIDALAAQSPWRRRLRPLLRHGRWLAAAAVVAGAVGAALLTQFSVTPEQARVRLAQMDYAFSPDGLVRAVETRDATAVKLFLRAGIDPNGENRRGVTALQRAAGNGDLAMVRALLKAGARAEEALAWAASQDDVATLEALLANEVPKAALDQALASEYLEPGPARLLLDRGADPDAVAPGGATPLTAAAYRRSLEVVKLLLERGAKVDAPRQDGTRRTALYMAVAGQGGDEAGTVAVVDALLERGAKIDVRVVDWNSTEGWTPLLAAAKSGSWAVARHLVERGADIEARSQAGTVLDERMRFGITPLMHAAAEDQADFARLLLGRGAQVDARSSFGRTALSFAAEAGHAGMVELLLAAGARADIADDQGRTPLAWATERGRDDVAVVLRRAQAGRR
jgi:ankyrin repeat protein